MKRIIALCLLILVYSQSVSAGDVRISAKSTLTTTSTTTTSSSSGWWTSFTNWVDSIFE